MYNNLMPTFQRQSGSLRLRGGKVPFLDTSATLYRAFYNFSICMNGICTESVNGHSVNIILKGFSKLVKAFQSSVKSDNFNHFTYRLVFRHASWLHLHF